MNNTIDISVIIPAFNAAASIGGLVHDLLSETTLRTEVIVVDDDSTDETWTILSAITDERLVLIHQENLGVYAARNAALAVHGGEWVVFLDADDQVADGFLQKRLQAAREARADVAVFNGWRADSTVTIAPPCTTNNLTARCSPVGSGFTIASDSGNGRITCGCR